MTTNNQLEPKFPDPHCYEIAGAIDREGARLARENRRQELEAQISGVETQRGGYENMPECELRTAQLKRLDAVLDALRMELDLITEAR